MPFEVGIVGVDVDVSGGPPRAVDFDAFPFAFREFEAVKKLLGVGGP